MDKVKIEAELIEPAIVGDGIIVGYEKICSVEVYEEIEEKKGEANEEKDKCD